MIHGTLRGMPGTTIHVYLSATGDPTISAVFGLFDVRDDTGALIASDVTLGQVAHIARQLGARVVKNPPPTEAEGG